MILKVKIQCPECGQKLRFRFAPCDYVCDNCRKDFSEHEIRERCAI